MNFGGLSCFKPNISENFAYKLDTLCHYVIQLMKGRNNTEMKVDSFYGNVGDQPQCVADQMKAVPEIVPLPNTKMHNSKAGKGKVLRLLP